MNRGYRWAASGDINAFFGLLLDNMAGLILMVTLLEGFGKTGRDDVTAMPLGLDGPDFRSGKRSPHLSQGYSATRIRIFATSLFFCFGDVF